MDPSGESQKMKKMLARYKKDGKSLSNSGTT